MAKPERMMAGRVAVVGAFVRAGFAVANLVL
jgi:hypothetical protein